MTDAELTRLTRETERAILAAEGAWHVAGRYIADANLADRERRREAEYRVREQIRRYGYLLPTREG